MTPGQWFAQNAGFLSFDVGVLTALLALGCVALGCYITRSRRKP